MSKANDINDHKEAEKRRQRLALNLAAHFNEMLAENDKLKAENDKLKAENNKLRAENIELSSYDQKTSLHSQKFFDDRLHYTIERLKRAGTGTATLIAIDLNDFSTINNKYGHHIGDKALLAWANTIGQLPRSVDVVARSNTAGDEFFVLFDPETKEQVPGEPGHEAAVERFREGLENVYIEHEGKKIHITGSLGIVQVTAADTVESVKERADAAMYVAKAEFKKFKAANNNEASAAPVPSPGG